MLPPLRLSVRASRVCPPRAVDVAIAEFLRREGISVEDVAALCGAHRGGASLCVDYILAMVEYERFMGL